MSLTIKTVEDINKITVSLYKHATSSIEEFVKNKKINVACHSGCDVCCKTIRVEILPAEAFYLVEQLKQRFSIKKINYLREKLKINNAKAINKNIHDYGNENIECVFLENNQCSIYDFRPYKCRAYLAKDSDFCKRDKCWTEQVPELNYDQNIHKIIMKYINTLKENDLDNNPAELSNAILNILEDETLLSRYINKEKNLFNELIF
jgi:Fe-S-cluster containining protein